MTPTSRFHLKDHREVQKAEVASKENQLWALIHSKSLLHSDVQNLCGKVRSIYENLILNDCEQLELQGIEYSLWKLYYKLIDEFRKRIKRSSAAPRNGSLVEGFKLLLSDGIEFYQNLIVKVRECNGLSKETVFSRLGANINFGEQKKIQKCQFLCHRFLVCLGDLARYKEQCEKPDLRSQNWSVAATYYLEATRLWPDSGHPQNQLAVLAMYIGDEFLALYHCIRSLAVKSPFAEAQDNLTLLFEKNRSSNLHISSEGQFNFFDPSKRCSTSQDGNADMVKAESCTHLWSLVIRTLSFLHLKLSVNKFPIAFASTMREFDELMAVDDLKLEVTLESYQFMGSVRRGPYRVLQLVSVLIFIIQNLVIKSPEIEDSKNKNDMQHIELTQLALAATFIFMGCFVERCLKASAIESCPLLPAVLVFVEWLVLILDEAELYVVDEKSKSAMSYFFGELIDLLERLNANVVDVKYPKCASLWEDYELRGFAPVSRSHASLDFSSHWEHVDNYKSGADSRTQRIIHAAIKIADRTTESHKWIIYDESRRIFCKCHMTESTGYPKRKESEKLESNNSDIELIMPSQKIDKAPEECEEQINAGEDQNSTSSEEEEVILFRPLTRRNSAPVNAFCLKEEPTSLKYAADHNVPSDDCLRRATSLLIAQNQAQTDHFSFHADMTHFVRDMSHKQHEPVPKDTSPQPSPPMSPITAGPPSLNAWVLDRGSLSNSSREKSTNGTSRHGSRLSPIEEVTSESFYGLSIGENEDSMSSHDIPSTSSSSTSYTAPEPSAPPLLPEYTPWFHEGISNASDVSYSQVSSYPLWTDNHMLPDYRPRPPGIPSFMNKFPILQPMSSSEWLRKYRESHSSPSYVHPPGNLGGNIYGYDTSRLNQWGNLAASNPTMHLDNSTTLLPGFPLNPGISGYQRTGLYGCGAVTDLRNEQPPLLQYLKERETQLQRDPNMRGPSLMDN